MWFLNTRSEPVGGDVCPVRITDGNLTYPTYSQLLSETRGRHLLIGVHGFNVHQAGGVDHLEEWNKLLSLGESTLFLGALWPGDSSWLGALEYPFAAKAAMRSGEALASFINTQLTQSMSVSFVSHSLGARVALGAIQQLAKGVTVRRLIMMAPAIDDNCLTNEFAAAARRVDTISVLASRCDQVLKLAYPLGNPLSGIFAQGHPYWHAALGREGPAAFPSPNNLHAGWMLPEAWKIDHGDYLPPSTPFPSGLVPSPYTQPISFPDPQAPAPDPNTPQAFFLNNAWEHWQCAWTAALTSIRFH